jgi:hypothetical protein
MRPVGFAVKKVRGLCITYHSDFSWRLEEALNEKLNQEIAR